MTSEPQDTEQQTTDPRDQPHPSGLHRLRERINSIVVGQKEIVDQVLVALLANGHVLVEGVPGLGKTLLVRVLADSIGGTFRRIQFTPDLMPADVTGHAMFDMQKSQFTMRKGPVFTNLLLADEINRSPAKTQAALLEVMQERQVTLDGEPHELPKPFMVLGTQNPIEQEGTYPLPEAELDRFLMKLFIDYPAHEDEISLTRAVTQGASTDLISESQGPLLSAEEVLELQRACARLTIDDQVLDYAVRLVRATRETSALIRGAGPRASIALVRCARAHALLAGRDFVTPDDVKALALPVMRHRVLLAADMEIDGLSADDVLSQLFSNTQAPRE